MATKINADGTFAIEYEGPYAGLDVESPETLISDKASPSFNNFMLRNAELRSRPQLVSPFQGASSFQLGITSFLDINGMYHTCTWANTNLYQLNPALIPGYPWLSMTGAPGNMGETPLSYRTFANTLYYSAIGFLSGMHIGTSLPFVAYWDGLAAAPVFTNTFSDASVSQSIAGISLTDSPTVGGSLPGGPTITGPIAIGGGFLGELNNQLILANVSIRDQGAAKTYSFPNVIWWSANGLPLQWDPIANTSAGFNAFLDVADQITGLLTLGIAGYIFRNFGITQMAPTGSTVTPWEFDHMWASDHGIGNVFPWSIAQYGPQGAFVAQDNVYALSITNAEPIGGKARDAIMADLALASFSPMANIIPIFVNGYVYLTYQILIPINSFVRNYVYSFEDKNWAAWDLALPTNPIVPFPQITCPPNVV